MSAPRPPELPGLRLIGPIGTGGFADVHLYEQALPLRRVAVKVLRETSDAVGLAQFHAEANVMAQLSGHPSIVPIYQADVSADGRAYLVMEYCPPPHLAQRYRVERLPVPEVLDIAVRIASAVETAHRAGILHRDIKPPNILTSAYGAPLLTDFGIASVGGHSAATYGMSVPWSPPEAFEDDPAPDVRSDVYALAATIYSLLAGRSPFEIPGGANDQATLMDRIARQAPSRVLRADVPDQLNALLLGAMAKRVEDRPASAMAFARAIQEVQIALGLPATRLEVMDASPPVADDPGVVDDDRTQVKPVSIILPDEIRERGTLLRPRTITQADDHTRLHPAQLPPLPDTVNQRGRKPVGPPPGTPVGPPPGTSPLDVPLPEATSPAARGRRSPWPAILGALALLVVAGVVVVAFAMGSSPKDDAAGDPEPTASQPLAITSTPPAPTDFRPRVVAGRVVVTWTNPDPQPRDTYRVATGARPTALGPIAQTRRTRAETDGRRGEQVCAEIAIVRDGVVGPSLRDCEVAR